MLLGQAFVAERGKVRPRQRHTKSVQKLEFTYEGPEHREWLAWEAYSP